VVRVYSSTAVTIRIKPNGPTYSSDVIRLRKVQKFDIMPVPRMYQESLYEQAMAAACFYIDSAGRWQLGQHASGVVDMTQLQRTLAKKFPSMASTARPNPHAAPGTPLHARFAAAAVAAGSSKVVDIMLHGTPETNIDSILQTSLRSQHAYHLCWFTDTISKAVYYARGAKRIIAFAVLRDKNDAEPICTTQDPAHHLPLMLMELKV
jgi:hypothetical protein